MLRLRTILFNCQAVDPIEWNAPPASVIHGGLGKALFDLSCIFPGCSCTACPHHAICSYGYGFASTRPSAAERMRGYDQVPAPYRIGVNPWDAGLLMAGDSFEVTLSLYGRATAMLAIFAEALIKTLDGELGRKNKQGCRGRATIFSIQDASTDRIWKRSGGNWSRLDASTHDFDVSDAPEVTLPATLEWLTPLRLVENGKVTNEPTFRGLMSSLLRRFSNLLYFHEGTTLELDFKSILDQAASIQAASQWRRIPIRRYSARQQQAMRLDGLLGSMTLPGEAKPFLPWLWLGQETAVGKNTTLGMGHYQLKNKIDGFDSRGDLRQ